jgi:cob(I)alamin adenosyltransferase
MGAKPGSSEVAGSRRPTCRVEAYGDVDELNAALGMAAGAVADEEIRSRISRIQNDLFSLGASLATPGAEDGSARPATPPLPAGRVEQMEAWIDAASDETPPLRSFILPSGTNGAAILHVARTICRRAERSVVRLTLQEASDPEILKYLNRLSDLLFALARLENHRAGVPDTLWDKAAD